MDDTDEYRPIFPYFKHLQALDPSSATITKPLSYKIGETFYEGFHEGLK